MQQEAITVLRLTQKETEDLKVGVNLVNGPSDKKFAIYRPAELTDGEEGENIGIRACMNICKHQGGTFIKDIEDLDSSVLRCTKHGWRLDCQTMQYVNPPNSFRQEELIPEFGEDGGLKLVELRPPQPWQQDPRNALEIKPGEVEVTYFSHACVEMKLGEVRMFTDPWLTGPAFARGWWLLHEPPCDWLDRLASTDFIYISHLHSDHLSYPTLEQLYKRNPDVPIYVGDVSTPVFSKMEEHGVKMNNITVLEFGVWKEINADLRFMILMDGVHPELDTCLLIDYKGHFILDTVDCTNPNGGRLPHNVDVMMSDFAGGAAGFPMTFHGGKYTEDWKRNFIKSERRKLLYYKTQVVRKVNPVVYFPFAGYFVEAHPSDKYIKDTNAKISPNALNDLINKHSPDIKTWTPLPGSMFDLGKILKDKDDITAFRDPPPGTKILKDDWDFDKYLDAIDASIYNEIFAYPEWVEFYYKWCQFKNYNLVVKMIETDDNFQPIEGAYTYMVDFVGEVPTFPSERPDRTHNYLEIRNRIGVHRQTMLTGMFWDDLYIGFNNRITRDPDTFHYQFWNYMQVLLPQEPPKWEEFLEEQRAKGARGRSVWAPSNKALIKGTTRVPQSYSSILCTAALSMAVGVAAAVALRILVRSR
ncbi:cytidine monophosphate-N-acetylneuraminic acid hydroxylase-like [Saccoglossus kowalevskii]|uniref:Cytidine monophosphate-N-acetylneuraminic acid hydroxylase n=1 Tax=Saccoglossus kowalevskii TaxID=10224 RepID=A0A0U2U2F9_SACKO|nr:PREDICTED: cytidine monophosphate-N-acetylneuraminic acid hydroxylase-like isoform X1 [Saccoglossus kowalevskii]XP_006813035.1 PREDICTED: cytidine monophosphate-N-acetylneuraminic acid hydroxylase-like isoform X2 [Saccoglossus kowalevskii]ALR88572.1 cytidine monophosphate-n-acetylneuraminic acid hydroxylase-like [Saccoglossus kowalevskii]